MAKITPEGVLDLFGIDKEEGGGLLFRGLCWKLYDGMGAAAAVADLCRFAHLPRAAVYGQMKRALAPVRENPDWLETLQRLGVEPVENTVEFARLIAQAMEGAGE